MKKTTWSTTSWHFRVAKSLGNLSVTWIPDPKTPEEVERVARGDTWHIEKKAAYYGNLCDYIPSVIEGMVKLFLGLAAGTIILIPVAIYLAYLAACVTTWSIPEIDGPAALGMWMLIVSTSATASIFGMVFAKHKFDEYREKKEAEERERQRELKKAAKKAGVAYVDPKYKVKEPGFLVQCFRKFKDKTCIGLEIK